MAGPQIRCGRSGQGTGAAISRYRDSMEVALALTPINRTGAASRDAMIFGARRPLSASLSHPAILTTGMAPSSNAFPQRAAGLCGGRTASFGPVSGRLGGCPGTDPAHVTVDGGWWKKSGAEAPPFFFHPEDGFYLARRRRIRPAPSRPAPSRAIDAGSGTASGGKAVRV